MTTRRKSVQIDGMTCSHSEQHIEYALDILPGLYNIRAHFPIDAAFIEYDPSRLDWDRFDQQLDRIGYSRIETMSAVTISTRELVCPSVVSIIRSMVTEKQWIEEVQILLKPASIRISFDSRAWTKQEIVQMVYDLALQ